MESCTLAGATYFDWEPSTCENSSDLIGNGMAGETFLEPLGMRKNWVLLNELGLND